MAAPVIALRFRDSTPGVDTIREHRALIADRGSVWWGWWRKETEEIDAGDVERMLLPGSTQVLLVNRASHRSYVARCEGFTVDIAQVSPEEVPHYYRSHLGEVAGFFRFRIIEDTPYDDAIGKAFEENTLLHLAAVRRRIKSSYLAPAAGAPDRSFILHLSDLHFGADYGFRRQNERPSIGDGRRTLTDCLVTDLERLNARDEVAAVIVTGDFITRGDWNDQVRNAALQEFEALRQALKLGKEQIIAVPGNHDIVRYPDGATVDISELAVAGQTKLQHEREFRTFVDELNDRSWKESLNYVRRIKLTDVDVLLSVLNSCTITATEWREYGYVGPSGIDVIRKLTDLPVDRPTFRFIALHHHLLPVAEVEAPASKGVTLALDASAILAEAQAAGVHVALHGHQHKAKLSVYQTLPLIGDRAGDPIHVVANGSAGATRLPTGLCNTYCLFGFSRGRIHLWIRELRQNGQQGAQLFSGDLAAEPASA